MKNRSLKINTIYSVIYRFINVVFPLILSIYTSRILLPYGIGKVSSIQNVVAYFSVVSSLGLPNYGIKEIAKSKNNKQDMKSIFCKLFTINFLSTSLTIFMFFICVNCLPNLKGESKYYYICGISLLLNYINFDWFYYGIEEFYYITIRSFATKILSVIFAILLVKNQTDYVQYLLVSCFVSAGNNILNFLNLKKYGIKIVLDFRFNKHIKPIIILFLTNVSIELYTFLDITMLNILSDKESVGYYAISSKLTKVIITFIVSISGALLPKISSLYSSGNKNICENLINKVLKSLIFFAAPAGIGWWFTSPYIILICYGSNFEGSIITAKVFSLLLYSLTFSNLFGVQILLTVNKEINLLISTLFGMIVNILLNLLLIPKYMQNGAAIASVLSEISVTVTTFIFARNYFNIKIDIIFFHKIFIGTLILSFYLFICDIYIDLWTLKIIVMVIGGGCLYICSQILVRNPIIKDFIR